MLAMVLFLGSQVMAQDIPPNFSENSFEARMYHESFGPGSSVGGWKLGLGWRFPIGDSSTEAVIKDYSVEFVNQSNGDSYMTKPHYCYDTVNSAGQQVRECDAHVWFGNRLNVTDGATADSAISDWKIWLNGNIITTKTPPSEKINYVPFVKIDKMLLTGPNVKITYTASELADTYIRLQIQDFNFSPVKTYTSKTEELTFGTKQKIYLPAEYAGYNARFEYRMNDESVRKILWIKLPAVK